MNSMVFDELGRILRKAFEQTSLDHGAVDLF